MSLPSKKTRRENSGFSQRGIAQFSGTGTSVTVPCHIDTVESAQATAIGANEAIGVTATEVGGHVKRDPTTKTITFARAAAGAADLKFFYEFKGE